MKTQTHRLKAGGLVLALSCALGCSSVRAEPDAEVIRTVANQCYAGLSLATLYGIDHTGRVNRKWERAAIVYQPHVNRRRSKESADLIATNFHNGHIDYEAIAVYADTCSATALGGDQ